MKIKKVDDKPMVIHTKKKAKLHTHELKKSSEEMIKHFRVDKMLHIKSKVLFGNFMLLCYT